MFHGKKTLSLAITVATLSTGNLALAQSGDSENIGIEEIVVTSRKREESYVDVPVSVTVFTETEVESAGIETPADFIALTPNVTLVQV
ncbi:MAG: TonB-dependent receptor, partial [Gammaproteobacteria bacterium]|nr:TonB-dependent receptor [Gammaproteobacteria bacterium]